MSNKTLTMPSLNSGMTFTCMSAGSVAVDLTSDEALQEYQAARNKGESIIIMDSNDDIVFNNEHNHQG